MALMEHTVYDPRNGRAVTDNLADYLVPVNADVQRIDVRFLDIPDPHISSIGARGTGEIAITGAATGIRECGLSRHRNPRARSADHD